MTVCNGPDRSIILLKLIDLPVEIFVLNLTEIFVDTLKGV